MNVSLSDSIGILGSLLIVAAYFANLRGSLPTTGPTYSALNLLGAAMIFYSLTQKWNTAAAVMEGFWAAISAYGLVRAFRRSR